MAILNFIKMDTYSTLSCTYSKHRRFLSIEVLVWSNSLKEELLTTLTYHLDGRNQNREVESIISSPQVDGKWYLVSLNTVNETLLPYAGTIVRYEGESEGKSPWNSYAPGEKEVIYIKDSGQHLVRTSELDYPWRDATNVFDTNIWDRHFSIQHLGGIDERGQSKNILRSVYQYLMTRSEFQETIEG